MKLNDMCTWERKKAIFLLEIAENDLGMNTSEYGELAVNTNSGYTYLWLEDYMFTLFMPISCELQKTDIYALWTNFNDGTEEEMQLSNDTTLEDIENWAEELNKELYIEAGQ